jgi:hypothetical protein
MWSGRTEREGDPRTRALDEAGYRQKTRYVAALWVRMYAAAAPGRYFIK